MMMMILKLKMARKTAKNNNRGVCSRRPVQNFVDTAPAKDLSYADATRPLEGDEVPFPKVRMFSPIEMNYAFVFAAYRDHDDPQKMEEWKRLVCFENTPSFIHIGMCLRVAILPIRHFLTVSFAYRMDDVSLDEPPGFNIIKHFPSENYPQTWCPQPVMLSSARALWGFTCLPARRDSVLGCESFWCPKNWKSFSIGLNLLALRTIELHGVALKHTPLQQFYNIIGFKLEYEKKHGAINSEALAKLYEDKVKFASPDDAAPWTLPFLGTFSDYFCKRFFIMCQCVSHLSTRIEVSASFVDTACTMGNRVSCKHWYSQSWCNSVYIVICNLPTSNCLPSVLRDKQLAELLLKSDEEVKPIFDRWSKFQILIQQGRTPDGIKWVFNALCLVRWLSFISWLLKTCLLALKTW